MPRPIQALIDLSALEHNLRAARRATNSRIMAVLKASAYGHGLLRTARALQEADGLALLDVNEAVVLRESGFRQTLLLLEGIFAPEELSLAAEYDLACVIHDPRQIDMLDAYPRRGTFQVWLKINSGMNRLGFSPQHIPAVLEKLQAHPAVRDVTLMTHFANADETIGVAAQLEVFNTLAASYRLARSLANSAALLRYPETHAEWVRPGIMLYGASPFPEISAQQLGLKPVMTLQSEIISMRELKAGEHVGYGGIYCAESAMRIGTVACGYADGYPRHAPTGTPVLVAGRRTRTLGRVSMDMLSVDLSTLADVEVGSLVTLWGTGLPVEEIARSAGTVSYELLCALAPRVQVTF
ncbi:MAG: alanine racemase [Nitrosomonadales bacterium]